MPAAAPGGSSRAAAMTLVLGLCGVLSPPKRPGNVASCDTSPSFGGLPGDRDERARACSTSGRTRCRAAARTLGVSQNVGRPGQ
ncbi:hypothetical protein SCOCK_150021 [Actinacidiphila cocklensis]|uniref:Uncharacterized protein n=1 Tax=Actinacidiphila cocklensis TaxID=887465 RepID=A0A9W4DKV9_9ACTN|nr:hypothetical protein SCOCK_150021 [Actinacidiphila cocklensis]